jgi:RNA-directed DNA polymerase
MQTSLHGIAEAARRHRRRRFRSLYSCFNRVLLEQSYRELNKGAAAGVDGVTYEAYGKDLQRNLLNLEQRLKSKRYHAKLVRRAFIPKPTGGQRPLGIPALEDKIVQNLGRRLLEALFEPLFLECSYAYRPGRSARQAAQQLQEQLRYVYVWVVEADITSFFESIDHDLLVEMLRTRIKDEAFIRLIQKWLRAGVLHRDGSVEKRESGTPQGGIISPVLANIYLHFALDRWFETEVKRASDGEALLVRYADDFVAAFRYHRDASRFHRSLRRRMAKFSLGLAEAKTRKVQFNRFKKAESGTFSFLGFEFRRVVTRRGFDTVRIRTDRKRVGRIVKGFSEWCRTHRNMRMWWIMAMVKAKLRGLREYFGVPGNSASLRELNLLFRRTLYRWLNRRSERRSYTWVTFGRMWDMHNVSSLRRLYAEGYQLSFLPFVC